MFRDAFCLETVGRAETGWVRRKQASGRRSASVLPSKPITHLNTEGLAQPTGRHEAFCLSGKDYNSGLGLREEGNKRLKKTLYSLAQLFLRCPSPQ